MAQLVTGVCLPKGKKEACGGARVPVCERKDFLLQGRRGNGSGQLPRSCASLIRSSSLQSGHSFPTWRVGSFFVHPGSCNLEHRKELMHGCLGDGQLLSSFFFPLFLGPHLPHMEIPSLGVKSDRSCSCRPTPQPQGHRIQAESMTYTTAHGNAGSSTH